MADRVKTTLTFPENLMHRAKIRAVQEKITVSELIREGLEARISQPLTTKKIKKKDPMSFLGAFSIGIKKIYNKRSDLYEEHLKRKMGY